MEGGDPLTSTVSKDASKPTNKDPGDHVNPPIADEHPPPHLLLPPEKPCSNLTTKWKLLITLIVLCILGIFATGVYFIGDYNLNHIEPCNSTKCWPVRLKYKFPNDSAPYFKDNSTINGLLHLNSLSVHVI